MNIPERFEDGTLNPFAIEAPRNWQEIQTLLELHSAGETDYDREMRRRAVRALMSWATPDVDAETTEAVPAGDAETLPVGSFDEWVTRAAIVTGRVASALHDCALSGCTDSAHAEMRAALPFVEHLAAEFRRLVGNPTQPVPWE